MAVLKAYLDDSGDETDRQHNAVALAGYIGTVDAWEVFEREWRSALALFEVPFLHMKEFAHFVGAFEGWRDQEEKRRDLIRALAGVIGSAGLDGIGAVVMLNDLAHFNADHGTAIEPMPLAIYLSMLEIYHRDPDQWVEMRIDGMKQCGTKLDKARNYSRSHWGSDLSHIITATCETALTFRQILPLQAADLAAYEGLKLARTPAATLPDGNPKRRQSFNALLDAAPLAGMVVDYDTLRQLHDWRRGVWEIEPDLQRER